MNNLKELILSKKSIHFFIIFLSLLRIFVIYFSTKEKSVKISRTYLKRSSLKTRSIRYALPVTILADLFEPMRKRVKKN